MKQFRIVGRAYYRLGISLFLLFCSLVVFLFSFSPSIEFTGGIKSEIQTINPQKIEKDLMSVLSSIVSQKDLRISTVSDVTTVVIQTRTIHTGFSDIVKKHIQGVLGSGETILSFSSVGSSFGNYARSTAVWSLVGGIILMVIYIFFAFAEIRKVIDPLALGIITILTMLFDVIVPLGVYGIGMMMYADFQVDSLVIIAVLSIMGYSINDTIIILDRVRENILLTGEKKLSRSDYENLFDRSLRQSMRRSIGTSFSTILVLIAMCIFGEGDMQRTAFIIGVGVIVGTYSSIFIATPGLFLLITQGTHLSSKK